MPRLQHANCMGSRCAACKRNDDALGVAAGTFGCLVICTVCPFTVLFVMAAHALAGIPGAWAAVAFLVALPALAGASVWISEDRKN